jgi:succinylglutamate desuccinylase
MSIQVGREKERQTERRKDDDEEKKKKQQLQKSSNSKERASNLRRCLASYRQEEKERVEWPLGIHTNA